MRYGNPTMHLSLHRTVDGVGLTKNMGSETHHLLMVIVNLDTKGLAGAFKQSQPSDVELPDEAYSNVQGCQDAEQLDSKVEKMLGERGVFSTESLQKAIGLLEAEINKRLDYESGVSMDTDSGQNANKKLVTDGGKEEIQVNSLARLRKFLNNHKQLTLAGVEVAAVVSLASKGVAGVGVVMLALSPIMFVSGLVEGYGFTILVYLMAAVVTAGGGTAVSAVFERIASILKGAQNGS